MEHVLAAAGHATVFLYATRSAGRCTSGSASARSARVTTSAGRFAGRPGRRHPPRGGRRRRGDPRARRRALGGGSHGAARRGYLPLADAVRVIERDGACAATARRPAGTRSSSARRRARPRQRARADRRPRRADRRRAARDRRPPRRPPRLGAGARARAGRRTWRSWSTATASCPARAGGRAADDAGAGLKRCGARELAARRPGRSEISPRVTATPARQSAPPARASSGRRLAEDRPAEQDRRSAARGTSSRPASRRSCARARTPRW